MGKIVLTDKEKCTISIRLPEIQTLSGPSQSMTWFLLAVLVTKSPIQVYSPISPCYLMTERDPVIKVLRIFYSMTIGVSEILVTIVIVFLWQTTLNLSYINTSMWEEE